MPRDVKKYPECQKLSDVGDDRRILLQFLEWLDDKGIRLGKYKDNDFDEVTTSKDNLLLEYFEVDPVKLEEERRAMIEELQR